MDYKVQLIIIHKKNTHGVKRQRLGPFLPQSFPHVLPRFPIKRPERCEILVKRNPRVGPLIHSVPEETATSLHAPGGTRARSGCRAVGPEEGGMRKVGWGGDAGEAGRAARETLERF